MDDARTESTRSPCLGFRNFPYASNAIFSTNTMLGRTASSNVALHFGKYGASSNQNEDFHNYTHCPFSFSRPAHIQSGWSVCRTGNGEKLSNSQVCCLAQLCLAAAWFLSISCATCTPSTLYSVRICHIILMPSLLYTHHHDAFYGNKSTPICAGISTPRYLPWRWSATRCRQECFRPTDAIEYCTASVVILIFRPTATATVSAPQS